MEKILQTYSEVPKNVYRNRHNIFCQPDFRNPKSHLFEVISYSKKKKRKNIKITNTNINKYFSLLLYLHRNSRRESGIFTGIERQKSSNRRSYLRSSLRYPKIPPSMYLRCCDTPRKLSHTIYIQLNFKLLV